MTDQRTTRRATLKDVAIEAGVSVATADRVVNGREGVRDKTVRRVEAAIGKLGYRSHAVATSVVNSRSYRLAFLLPANANSFMANLSDQVEKASDWLSHQNGDIDIRQVDVFDPVRLADALRSLPDVYDGVAVVALDDVRVRAALDELVDRGVHVVTLVSDVPGSRRKHYVGIDNPAAGRTAGSLMGRFLRGRQGTVGIVTGSLSLRDHAERLYGFRQVMTAEFPHLIPLPPLEGRDDAARNRALVEALLAKHSDLVGLYNAGAGNDGVAEALRAAGRAGDIAWIAHELTADTRKLLLDGTVEAVINQDPGHEARSAARVLLAQCSGQAIYPEQERIRIEIFMRDNLG
jgi:LacI family transcriptional regulator